MYQFLSWYSHWNVFSLAKSLHIYLMVKFCFFLSLSCSLTLSVPTWITKISMDMTATFISLDCISSLSSQIHLKSLLGLSISKLQCTCWEENPSLFKLNVILNSYPLFSPHFFPIHILSINITLSVLSPDNIPSCQHIPFSNVSFSAITVIWPWTKSPLSLSSTFEKSSCMISQFSFISTFLMFWHHFYQAPSNGCPLHLVYNLMFCLVLCYVWSSLVAQRLKNPPTNVGNWRSIPRLGRSPGKGTGYPLQYSCLENSMGRGVWWATVHGAAKSRTGLTD